MISGVGRIDDALGHAAQAQIDSVVGAGADLDETAQAIRTAQHAVDAAVARRQPRIARMAGHAHLAFGGHGDHGVQEARDPFPVQRGGDGFGEARLRRGRALQIPGAVAAAAAPGRHALGALVLQGAQVVLDGGDAGFGSLAHHVADELDLAGARLALAEHETGDRAAAHVELGHGQGDHLQVDAEPAALPSLLLQLGHVPAVVAVEGDRVLALGGDAVPGEELQVLDRRGELLRAQMHGASAQARERDGGMNTSYRRRSS